MKRKAIPAVMVALSQVVSCAHKPGATNAVREPSVPATRAPSSQEETPWTTWSEEKENLVGTVKALRVLKGVRDGMSAKNLHDPHVDYSGYASVNCKDGKVNTRFRQADGTCTDVERPHVGASGVAFGRNVPPEFLVSNEQRMKTLMTPNPAVISETFFKRDDYKSIGFLNMLAATWIQFMNHDWMNHGPNEIKDPYVVKGAPSHVQYVDQTKRNPIKGNFKDKFSLIAVNDVTHWWDASQIYGSNLHDQRGLRSFEGGRMKVGLNLNKEAILPLAPAFNRDVNRQNQGREATGFRDNWWLGLSMLHTLFVREHNAIADMLYTKYVRPRPDGTYQWTGENLGSRFKKAVLTKEQLDEHIFQTARLINAAILAKIHTTEWTPAILPNPTLKFAMCTNWYGAFKCRKKLVSHEDKAPQGITTDSFRLLDFGHVVGGIVGSSKRDDAGVPFSITEEFTSVYRLHSLLPEALELKTMQAPARTEKVPFAATRNENAYSYIYHKKTEDLFYSFGRQLPGQLVLNNFPEFMRNFEVKGFRSMDLGMVDIIRDRERGVPRYNQFRRGINLKPITKYTDFFKTGPDNRLTEDQQRVLEKFYKVYGKNDRGEDNVEAIDLLVGTLAEEVRPKDFGFGETMFHIFILMASRRLQADRFFTTDYNREHYTRAGLEWIDNEGTFAQVIGRHMPELKPKMEGLWTAFLPWKE